MPGSTDSVSAVMVTRNPDPNTMAWTLSRLADQDHPPKEIIIIDSSDTPLRADVEGIPTNVVYSPEDGISAARRRGVQMASGDYVLHVDEDSVYQRDDYISTALERVKQPNVSAAGGVVIPLRKNIDGEAFALAERAIPTPFTTHNLLHRREYLSGEALDLAFPDRDRSEDIPHRRLLKKIGRVERMEDQAVVKDLPTTRQRILEEISLGAIIGGVVTGLVTTSVQRVLNWAADEAEEAVNT
jgi:glycosyltransferase involved in cell wall biosynthesis